MLRWAPEPETVESDAEMTTEETVTEEWAADVETPENEPPATEPDPDPEIEAGAEVELATEPVAGHRHGTRHRAVGRGGRARLGPQQRVRLSWRFGDHARPDRRSSH